MWATRNPILDILKRTAGGGAAPAVMTWTRRGSGRMVSLGEAFTIELRTTGAAQKWVAPRLAIAE